MFDDPSRWYELRGKRIFDVLAASLAALVLSPVIAVVAVAIRLEDHGPVFFRQQRTGRDGRPFTIVKFRSMPTTVPHLSSDQAHHLVPTRVGRVIRRTNIDEIPQLVNILRGDMSFVGPRPPLPTQVELIELRTANGAMKALPGLTGLAQIRGYDGMLPPEKAAYDATYAQNITAAGDFRIIMRTLLYLLKPPPTY